MDEIRELLRRLGWRRESGILWTHTSAAPVELEDVPTEGGVTVRVALTRRGIVGGYTYLSRRCTWSQRRFVAEVRQELKRRLKAAGVAA
jgi:hypothetical protein